jgi:hypothetical protein
LRSFFASAYDSIVTFCNLLVFVGVFCAFGYDFFSIGLGSLLLEALGSTSITALVSSLSLSLSSRGLAIVLGAWPITLLTISLGIDILMYL